MNEDFGVDLLNDNNANNDVQACGKLTAFSGVVNTKEQNGDLTAAQATLLIESKQAIEASLGC